MNADKKAARTAGLGMMFALAIVLQFLENLVPSPFSFAPGIKMGLSNTVTMFALLSLGFSEALYIAALKGLFAFVTRGATAGILSTAGGIASVLVMMIMRRIGSSQGLMSVTGAVTHNMAQLVAESIMMKSAAAMFYIPVLTASGIVMGTITAVVHRTIRPYLEKLSVIEFGRKKTK